MKYKIGEIVILAKECPDRWNTRMRKLAGKAVTVSNANRLYLSIEELEGEYIFENEVERVATEEEIAEYNKKKAEEYKKVEEMYKTLVFTPDKVQSLANSVFGEDRVDVIVLDSNRFEVIIHFPDVIISNSRNQRHSIKHLYVKYYVEVRKSKFNKDEYKAHIEFTGIRMSYSLKEYESNYNHSHLPTGSYSSYNNFCLGSSNYALLIENLKMELSEDAWMLVFLSLENYIKWESIEGGPHMYMDTIRYSNSIRDSNISMELCRLMKEIPRNVIEFNNGINVITGHPVLYKYIDEKSSIRKLNCYTDEEEIQRVKEVNKLIAKNDAIIWKGKPIYKSVYLENVEEGHVSRDVIEKYSEIITKEGDKFIKKYHYERKKEQYSKRVFGKIRA